MAKKGGVPENLVNFKPGQSGNPNGRPKGRRSISTYLKMFVEGDVDSLPNGKLKEYLKDQGFDSVAAAMAYKKALISLSKDVKPDTQLRAMDSIEDRLEGRATQKTELTGRDGEALAISDVTEYENSLRKMTVKELETHQKLIEKANNLVLKTKEREDNV